MNTIKLQLVVTLVLLSGFLGTGCKTEKRVVIYIEEGKQFNAPVDGFFIDKETIMDMGNVIGQGEI